MKTPRPTVSARFVNNFLQGISIDSGRRERFIREAGIVPELLDEPATRITEEQFAALYRILATNLDDEMPGLFSRPLRAGTTKFLCLSLLDAPNLQIALYRHSRFHHLLLDDFVYELTHESDVARFAIVPNPAYGPLSAFGQQLMLKFVHGFACWLVGKTIPIARLHFAFPRPGDISEYGYLHPGPVFFDQPESALYLPVSEMDTPIVHRTKQELRAFLAKSPEGWIFASLTEPTIGQRVREYLGTHVQKQNDIECVAQALHLSVRTLCRRLESEGTSFQIIKDELRRDIAVQRLTKTSHSIASIAFELGFDDATTFHRAFKKWTGNTPGAYRRHPSDPAETTAKVAGERTWLATLGEPTWTNPRTINKYKI